MKTNPNESASGYGYANEQSHNDTSGLTKREHFAGLAMTGLMANSETLICNNLTVNDSWHHPETIAKISVQIADALISALSNSASHV